MVMMLAVVAVAAVAILMVVVMMLVVVAAAVTILVVMVMMLLVMVVMMVAAAMMLFLDQVLGSSVLALHGFHDLAAGQLIPGSGDERGGGIMLAKQSHSGIQLGLGDGIGPGQDNGGGGFDLVVVELTEVLHVNLHLAGIGNRHSIAQDHILIGDLLHRCDDIGQLAHTGGLDDDAVGMIAVDDLRQSLAEITHQTAADAAGVHLGDIDARILQKAAVDADLTEFILDEHQLLAAVGFLNHLLDKGGFAGSQKTGVNVDNSHSKTPSV